MGATFKRSMGVWDFRSAEGVDAQFLFRGERAVIVAARMPPGATGAPRHVHPDYDQVFYLLSGTMRFELGVDDFTIGPHTLVFIPRGTPHYSCNPAADEDAVMLDMAAPAPHPLLPGKTSAESRDAGDRDHLVRSVDKMRQGETLSGFTEALMLQRGDGSVDLTVSHAEIRPGVSGPGFHVHAFDQFYYVLEGELSAEVSTASITARPGDIVVIPAGVAHRQWNESTARTRHLMIATPSPDLSGPAPRTDVEFAVKSHT